ncbi:MAG: septum formation initiator family protein [Gemmatimonadota bacterium]|nr:septum formation initiator family protein [Gemmatimonadota bacterium]
MKTPTIPVAISTGFHKARQVRPAVAVGSIVATVGFVFGLMGGEYSTPDWWTMRRNLAFEHEAIERLTAEIDSLRTEAELLETDPVTQERVARERFGMLRQGEKLYRVERERP